MRQLAVILCDDGDPFPACGGTPLRRPTLPPSTKRIVVLAQDRGGVASQHSE